MRLFFDTETTGFADLRSRYDAPHQPHIVQLGAILCDDQKRVVAEMNLIVKPSGYTIPTDASNIHGITTERAERYGVALLPTMRLFTALCDRAEEIVAHNFPFDDMLVRAALHRSGIPGEIERHIARKSFCTMKASTGILKLPGKFGDYKWPNLQEAHVHFLGQKFDGAHDAMADVRACRDVYYAMHAPVPVQQPLEIQ